MAIAVDEKIQTATSVLPIILYAAALVLGLLDVNFPFANSELRPLAQWMLFLSLGLTSLWSASGHALLTDRVARSIGWDPSPFQLEVAGANLGIALAAITATFLGPGAAWATLLVAASFLWGAAVVHVNDISRKGNFSINNAGPILWWDILTPLTLLIALL
jgi:hypothetical protein